MRNGEWEYQAFKADKTPNTAANLTACFNCHKPLDKQDYRLLLRQAQGGGEIARREPSSGASRRTLRGQLHNRFCFPDMGFVRAFRAQAASPTLRFHPRRAFLYFPGTGKTSAGPRSGHIVMPQSPRLRAPNGANGGSST